MSTPRILSKICVSLIALGALTGCTGWDAEVTGTLTLDRPIAARNPNRSTVELESGAAHVEFRHGIIGLRYPRLLVRTARGTAELRVPRQAFKKGNQLRVSARELRQDFGITGGRNDRELQRWETSGNEECSYECGYSYPSTSIDANGNVTTTIQYVSQSCSGTQWAHRLNRRMLPVFHADLIAENGQDKLGQFESIGAEYVDSTILESSGAEYVDSTILESSGCR